MTDIEQPTARTTDHRQPSAAPNPEHWSTARTGAAVLAAGGVLVLASLIINPGPGLDALRSATYTPGHLLNGLGYLLIVLGLPVIAAGLGRSLGLLGLIGYGATEIRYVLSTGSQLFQVTIYRVLGNYPQLHAQLTDGGRLQSIYGGWGDAITLALSVALLGLVWSLWRADRSLRGPAALLLVSAVVHPIITPIALVTVAAAVIWLGLRGAIRGDIRLPLRTR